MSVLNRSIMKSLTITAILAGGFLHSSNVQPAGFEGIITPMDTGGTTDLPPVIVVPPPPPEPIYPPGWGGGGGGGGGDGGGGGVGGGGGPVHDPEKCALLMVSRPPMCPNPIPLPSTALYGDDKLPAGQSSSMRLAHNFVKGTASWEGTPVQGAESAIYFLEAALADQVTGLAAGQSLTDTNARLRMHLAMTCEFQVGASNQYRIGTTPTKPEEFCFQIMKAFDAEANDNQSFLYWFIDYQNRTGMPLSNYVPYGIIDMIDTRNSIGVKWEAVTKDAACSTWWTQVEQNMCGVP